MPVTCGNTVLTGDSGSVAFTPAGTSVCLLDFTDFPTADPGLITLPSGQGFLVGDVVQFTAEGGATLVTGLTAGTDYHIVNITDNKAQVSATAGGTAIAFTQSLSKDTEGGHINMALTEFTSVCNVTSFDFSLDRDKLKLQAFLWVQHRQAGWRIQDVSGRFIDGTGSIEVQFTADQSSMASRVIGSSLKKISWRSGPALHQHGVCASGTSITALRHTSKHL